MQGFASFFLVLAIVAGRCGGDDEKDPVKVSDVSKRAGEAVSNCVNNTAESLSAVSDLMILEDLSGAFTEPDAADSGPALAAMALLQSATGPSFADRFPGVEGLDSALTQAQGLLDGVGEMPPDETTLFVTERLFVERNLESANEKTATFLIDGEVACKPTCYGKSGCSGFVNPGCVQAWKRLKVRIVATPVGDHGLDIDVRIGKEQHSFFSLALRLNSIAFESDLAESLAAVRAFVQAMVAHDVIDDLGTPSALEGHVRFAVTVHGSQDVSLAAGLLKPLKVEIPAATGLGSLSMAAADPLWLVRARGKVPSLSVSVDVNAVDLALPFAELTGDSADDESELAVHVGGFGFSTRLDASDETLIEDLNLGDSTSTVRVDDQVLLALDLNENAGRAVDVLVERNDTEPPKVQLSPELDVRLVSALEPVAEHFADELPDLFLNGSVTVNLSNGNDVPTITPRDERVGNMTVVLEVVQGTLTLGFAQEGSREMGVTVPAGMCLGVYDTLPPYLPEPMGYFAITMCP